MWKSNTRLHTKDECEYVCIGRQYGVYMNINEIYVYIKYIQRNIQSRFIHKTSYLKYDRDESVAETARNTNDYILWNTQNESCYSSLLSDVCVCVYLSFIPFSHTHSFGLERGETKRFTYKSFIFIYLVFFSLCIFC